MLYCARPKWLFARVLIAILCNIVRPPNVFLSAFVSACVSAYASACVVHMRVHVCECTPRRSAHPPPSPSLSLHTRMALANSLTHVVVVAGAWVGEWLSACVHVSSYYVCCVGMR